MADLKEQLRASLDEAEWAWLKAHLQRGAVVLVSQECDLLEAGEKVATDQSEVIQDWISQGILTKPSIEQIRKWDANPSRRFKCLVVQPYVLIQELYVH